MEEVQLIDSLFVSNSGWDAKGDLSLRVGLPITAFRFTDEQLRAWSAPTPPQPLLLHLALLCADSLSCGRLLGRVLMWALYRGLHEGGYLVVQLCTEGWSYLNVDRQRVHVTVGISDDGKTDSPTHNSHLHRGKLSWPLEQQIRLQSAPPANTARHHCPAQLCRSPLH